MLDRGPDANAQRSAASAKSLDELVTKLKERDICRRFKWKSRRTTLADKPLAISHWQN